MGGWLEDWRVMLNATQDQIKSKLKLQRLKTMGKNSVILTNNFCDP